ncbi:hypothetical protein [Thalassospira marina]|uniref:Uncharacterized protein n=1 Tax=Thalassospira marina TaxID=2048283 RepID=A0A2N3L005_9PROT|nr:hypothetical protein [Thalassospira marina]AUG52155.1 hypothetical protein CSC3H3_05010 [Thalassospira marina]PKR56077.1 hypothetical protein COO20_02400 [Thalassospira marina]
MKKYLAGLAALIMLAGCEYKDAVVDTSVVDLMPPDIALKYLNDNFQPWTSGYDDCVLRESGVIMGSNSHSYKDLRLIIERSTIGDYYDLRLIEKTLIIPDFCSYYKGNDDTGLQPAEQRKIDRIATAFASLGVQVPAVGN